MSATRCSSRIASRSTTPVSSLNRITNYGSVKRRLQFDDSPSRAKAAKLSEVPFDTPKRTEHVLLEEQTELLTEDSPSSFLPSTPIYDANKILKQSQLRPRNVTPERARILDQQLTPVKRGTVVKNPEDNVILDLGYSTPPRGSVPSFETPKSVRRRLLVEDSNESKTDLYFSTFDFQTPTSTRSGFGTVPRTAEGGKYDRLCSPVKKAKTWSLPSKHENLCEAFKAMDRHVAICKAMGKKITFEDVQKNVQRKTHKDFTVSMLSQIIGVYPSSYFVKYQEHRAAFGKNTPGRKFDLVLEPNLKTDLESYWIPGSPKKTQNIVQFGTPVKLTSVCSSPKKNSDFVPLSPRKSPTKAIPQQRELRTVVGDRLEAWRAACRLSIFRYKLFQQVRDSHLAFLEKIGESNENFEEGIFHKEFDLESVPDPVAGELPQIPQRSIKEFITPVSNKFVLPEVVSTNLDRLKSPEKPTHSANGKVPLSPTKFAGDTPKLSLYERIMLKQKKNEERMAPIRMAREKRMRQLEGLEEVLYAVWNVFARLKPKTTSTVADMTMRVGRDCGKLCGEEISEHLELLCEVAPRFFEIYGAGIHGHKYMRLISSDPDDYHKAKQLITDDLNNLKNLF
ncbi:hypothetical protein FO519_009833 [Halicephalobus sp. NKZ332]|nr:hypothetical protein FO519_009833 [Halicephalobus sp. NKZ332]